MENAVLKGNIEGYSISSISKTKGIIYIPAILCISPLCAHIYAHIQYYRMEAEKRSIPNNSIQFRLKVLRYSFSKGFASYMHSKKLKRVSII